MGTLENWRAICACSALMSPTILARKIGNCFDVMERENRALLTRDRRLLMHAIVKTGYYPRSQNADEQTIEVTRRFNLLDSIAPFTRCIRCNGLLRNVSKAEIIERLEPLTNIYYEQFRVAPVANRFIGAGRTSRNSKTPRENPLDSNS